MRAVSNLSVDGRRGLSCLRVVLAGAAVLVVAQQGMAATTTISYMGWTTNQEDIAVYKELFTAFEKSHPGIRVKNRNVPWSGEVDYMAKYLTMTSARVAPDVTMIPFYDGARLSDAGVLVALEPYFAQDKSVKLTDWNEASVAASTWKGKVYILPMISDNWWVTYNSRAFLQAGLLDPGQLNADGNWSIETMFAAAQKLTRWEGTKMMQMGIHQMGDIWSVLPYVWGFGGDLFNAQGDTCIVDQPPAVKALSQVHDMVTARKSMSFSADSKKVAMSPWWQSFGQHLIAGKAGWQMGQVPFPAGLVSDKTVLAMPEGVAMSRQSKHKDAAWQLMTFLSSKEAARLWSKNGWQSARRDAFAAYGERMEASGIQGKQFLEEGMKRMHSAPRIPRVSTVWPRIDAPLTKAWANKMQVAQALAAAAKDATAELRRGRK